MPFVTGMTMNAQCKLQKRGLEAPCLMLKTNEAWARKQHRDRRAKHVELHADEQLSQAAA